MEFTVLLDKMILRGDKCPFAPSVVMGLRVMVLNANLCYLAGTFCMHAKTVLHYLPVILYARHVTISLTAATGLVLKSSDHAL